MSVYLGNSPVGVNAIYSPEAIAQVIIDRIYPIGSICMSVNSANPSTYLGGTWIAWGSGRVPVGVDPNDTSFDTVEETGGAKTHTLTAAEMPPHRHAMPRVNTSASDTGPGFTYTSSTKRTWASYSAYYGGSGTTAEAAGTTNAHNNLQPYITCYMWKRTA